MRIGNNERIMKMLSFGQRLKLIRKEAQITQAELSEKLMVSVQAISKWEKGESLPDVYLIARLAGLFGVSIEDLIWSKDTATMENRKYYVREVEETDKRDFCHLMREHRFLGGFLRLIDEDNLNNNVDDIYWNEYREEGKIFVLRAKEDDAFGGYVYVEAIGTNAPQLTMQFNKQTGFDETDFPLIHDLFNWISKEYQVRAVQAFVNSDVERALFAYLGYKDAEDEVMLALPV